MSLEFFYDYRSPYAYLADFQLRGVPIAAKYKPLDAYRVMKALNNHPTPACPAKLKYAILDSTRNARRLGVLFTPNLDLYQALGSGVVDPSFLSRLALAAMDTGTFDTAHGALFEAMWAGEADLVTPEGRQDFLSKHGLPRDLFAMAESEAITRRLKDLDDEAIERGVFGVPIIFVGDEMFFGNDRMDAVRESVAAGRIGGVGA
jgi:2-hydroxychromene-2-carboxylate isomerase